MGGVGTRETNMNTRKRSVCTEQEDSEPEVSDPSRIVSTVGDHCMEAFGLKSVSSLPGKAKDEVNITSQLATVSAKSVWGALRGLETFSQLVFEHGNKEIVVNKTFIRDSPRFRHRGILLDTARHYISVPLILKNLDAMSYNKFNVLHWHIVDDQSFPYESRTFPQMSQKGAYSSRFTYSQFDVSRVIEYARLRGIRLIPEFDTPGHTMSWGKAFPFLLTPCYVDGQPGRANYTQHHTHEVFNPIYEETYEFLRRFFKEIIETFPDRYIHLGMDEVYYACWKSNPHIIEFMRQKGFAQDEFYKLEQYYIERLMAIISHLGGSYVIWQDPIENGALPKYDTLVQIWKDTSLWDIYDNWQNYSMMVAQKGYKMILSSCWYLNYVNYGPDWESLYLCDPTDFTDDPKLKNLMIGGEACLWPRASAVAERLWSKREINNVDDAQFRLDQQRCRLLRYLSKTHL
ncbi:beta-hexosaminidase subunit beta-like [Octopus vulgaris]|uniref:beta-N-acetylhexosaminidase n=1 Tax=Octopus vulgaris TaxID=6645 RepID=A0AA36F0H1_OCTVU|nr:beta-hexosaminidase subunit beta-like [Octopus vulgaris]